MDEFVVVVAEEWAGVGVVEPLELLGDGERGGRHPAAGGVGIAYGFKGLLVGLGGDYVVLGHGVGEAGGEHGLEVVLGRHEHEFGHWGLLLAV